MYGLLFHFTHFCFSFFWNSFMLISMQLKFPEATEPFPMVITIGLRQNNWSQWSPNWITFNQITLICWENRNKRLKRTFHKCEFDRMCLCVCVDTNMIGATTWTCSANNNASFNYINIAMILRKSEKYQEISSFTILSHFIDAQKTPLHRFFSATKFCSYFDRFVTSCKVNHVNEVLSRSQITCKY